MSIQRVLDKLISVTPQTLSSLAYCGEGGGLVDGDGMHRMLIRTPCVLYSALTAKSLPNRGDQRLNLEWLCAAYCLVADQANSQDDVRVTCNRKARAMAEQVALLIEGSRFGAGTAKPTDLAIFEMDDGCNADLDQHSLSGYAVTWRQGVSIGVDVWAEQGKMPTEMYLGVSPFIGRRYIDLYWRVDKAPI